MPFPVLSDIDLGYSLSLDLIFWVGDQIGELYRQAGVELEKYHGNHAYFLPMASKFIVGRDGLVKARQVNIEFRERMEPEAIIAAAAEASFTGIAARYRNHRQTIFQRYRENRQSSGIARCARFQSGRISMAQKFTG